MKKTSLLNKIAFSTVCLLGIGGAITAVSLEANKDNAPEVAYAGVSTIYVADHDMKSSNPHTYESGGGSVTYATDGSKVTLTFNNFKYTGAVRGGTGVAQSIYYEGDLPIEVIVNGTNYIDSSAQPSCTRTEGVHFENSQKGCVFTGTGSLDVKLQPASLQNIGYVTYDVKTTTINGPALTIQCGDTTDGQGYMTNNSAIEMSYGTTFNVNSGKLVAIAGNNTSPTQAVAHVGSSYGIEMSKGTFNLNGGIVEAIAQNASNGQSWGICASSDGTFNLNDTANQLIAKGKNKAVNGGKFKHAIDGIGYNKYDGTGTSYDIDSGTGAINNNIKYANFTNEITATVTGYEGPKDGQPHTISVTNIKPSQYTIKYGTAADACTLDTPPSYSEYGSYEIFYKITAPACGELVDSKTVDIVKEDPQYTAPTAKADLVYDGASHALIDAGAIGDGATSIMYKVGETGEYSGVIPEATEPGTYNVYYKVTGDADHKTLEDLGPVVVTFAKAKATVDVAPAGITGLTYDGQEHYLISSVYSATHGKVVFRVGTSGNFSEDRPKRTNGGNYTIQYKALSDDTDHYSDSAVSSFVVSIARAANEYTTVPTAKTGLAYTGDNQQLITGGAATGGTVQYKLNNGQYGTGIPSAKNAGTYTIYYKVVGGSNYEDIAQQSFTVTIEKVDAVLTAPTVVEDLKYTGQDQALVVAGSTTGGTLNYSLDGTTFTNAVPKVKEAGEYTVYYRVDGGTNYNDIPAETLTVVISENDKALLLSTIDEANLFYESIKDAHPTIAETLKEHLDAAILVAEDPNKTVEQIGDATNDLIDALYNAQIQDTIADIENIGEVTYPDSKESIERARNSYDELADDQKELVTNYQDLLDAEAFYKALEDNAKANAVKALIDAIGKVELTEACKAKIDAAKAAYDALTEDQKELVTNKKVLFDDIELYNTLAHQPTVVDNGVKVEGKDGDLIPVNVTVKVEVKTNVKAQEGTVEFENIQKLVGNNQKISGVYDVKLMRTVGDVVTEIQPSDIKPGMIIIVEITLPDGLEVEGLKVLHIHSENDISYVENFKIDAGKLTFETDRLSEIAFVVPAPNSFPGWAIALIIIGGLLLLCCLFFLVMFLAFPRYIIDYKNKKVIRTIYVKKHYDMVLLLDTHLRKVRRNIADVYKNRADAENALKK